MSMSAQSGQNQGLWSQNGDTMSLGLGGVFQLMKEVALSAVCHSSAASVKGGAFLSVHYGNREAEPVIGGPVGGGELGYLAPSGPHAFEDIG